jgi:hypothetical protein
MEHYLNRPVTRLVVDGVKVLDTLAEAKRARTTRKPNRTQVREEAKARIRKLLDANHSMPSDHQPPTRGPRGLRNHQPKTTPVSPALDNLPPITNGFSLRIADG